MRFVRSNRKDNAGVPIFKVNNITLTKDCEKAVALRHNFRVSLPEEIHSGPVYLV